MQAAKSPRPVKTSEEIFPRRSRTRVNIFRKVKGDSRFRRMGAALEEVSPNLVGDDPKDDVPVQRGSREQGVLSDEAVQIRVSDVAVRLVPREHIQPGRSSGADARSDQPF